MSFHSEPLKFFNCMWKTHDSGPNNSLTTEREKDCGLMRMAIYRGEWRNKTTLGNIIAEQWAQNRHASHNPLGVMP